jgi:hypothetical protein
MKLASLKEGGRDGSLIVVNRELSRAVRVPQIAPTLQRALEDWSVSAPRLNAVYEQLQSGSDSVEGQAVFAFELPRWPRRCRAPTNSSMARPTCRTSSACVAPAAPPCRRASTSIR